MWVATESAPARVNHAHGPGASRGGEHGDERPRGRVGGEGARAADEERWVTDTETDEMDEHLHGLDYLE